MARASVPAQKGVRGVRRAIGNKNNGTVREGGTCSRIRFSMAHSHPALNPQIYAHKQRMRVGQRLDQNAALGKQNLMR